MNTLVIKVANFQWLATFFILLRLIGEATMSYSKT